MIPQKFQRNNIELCRDIISVRHIAQDWWGYYEEKNISGTTASSHIDHCSPRKRSTKKSGLRRRIYSNSNHGHSEFLSPHSHKDLEMWCRLPCSSRLLQEKLQTHRQQQDSIFQPYPSSQRRNSITSSYYRFVEQEVHTVYSLQTREEMSVVSKKENRESQSIKQSEQNLLAHSSTKDPRIQGKYYDYCEGKRQHMHSMIIQNARQELIRRQTWLISGGKELIKRGLR